MPVFFALSYEKIPQWINFVHSLASLRVTDKWILEIFCKYEMQLILKRINHYVRYIQTPKEKSLERYQAALLIAGKCILGPWENSQPASNWFFNIYLVPYCFKDYSIGWYRIFDAYSTASGLQSSIDILTGMFIICSLTKSRADSWAGDHGHDYQLILYNIYN